VPAGAETGVQQRAEAIVPDGAEAGVHPGGRPGAGAALLTDSEASLPECAKTSVQQRAKARLSECAQRTVSERA